LGGALAKLGRSRVLPALLAALALLLLRWLRRRR